MTKWEYAVIDRSYKLGSRDEQMYLDEQGLRGWELCGPPILNTVDLE